MPHSIKRVVKVVSGVAGLVIILLMFSGAVYEQVGEGHDRNWPPRVGQAYDVGGGRTMNIHCSGEGSATVVLENGAGEPGIEWSSVESELAKKTRTCWYDRAGLGWSDLSDAPRTGENVVQDLHALLRAARADPPYVLVGKSVGGLYIRLYTAKFPAQVAGLVFVDSSHEDQHEPKSHESAAARMTPWQRNTLVVLNPVLYHLGIYRFLINQTANPAPGPIDQPLGTVWALHQHPSVLYAAIKGGDTWEMTADEVRRAGNLGDRPAIVLTAGSYWTPPDPRDAEEEVAFQDVWQHRLQPSIARLSTRGKQLIVANADHRFESEEGCAAIVNAVSDVLRQIKGTSGASVREAHQIKLRKSVDLTH